MPSINKYLLLLTSAMLLFLPSVLPGIFVYGIFFFLIPVFYLALLEDVRSKDGFLWGLFFYFFHLWWLAVLLYERAYGDCRLALYIFMIFYFSIFSFLWFACAIFLSRYLAKAVGWFVLHGFIL